SGEQDVFLRGRGVAAGMIVSYDEMRGALSDRRSEDLSGMHDGRGQAAGRDEMVADQAILGVEEERDEVLAPVVRDDLAGDGGGELWGVDAVPNGGLARADDRVGDLGQISLAG